MPSYLHLPSIIVFTTLYIHCLSQKYILVKQIKTVDEAETYCNNIFGTSLASIHSSSDNTEATQLCTTHTKCIQSTNCQIGCSIGLNDKQNEQGSNPLNWQWTDNSSFDYLNWQTGEPNEFFLFRNGEDCAMMYANNHPWYGYPGKWNDCPCDGGGDYKQWFLCNAPTSSPTNAPTIKTTNAVTISPSNNPTISPSNNPTVTPTKVPTLIPSNAPTKNPTVIPTENPTLMPTENPTMSPTSFPTSNPTIIHTMNPTSLLINIVNVTKMATENNFDVPPSTTTINSAMQYIVHNHHSVTTEHMYMFVGLFGGLIFLFLCVCCFLICGCVYICKQKRKNKLEINNDQIEIIHKTGTTTGQTTSSMIYQHHYYHHTVQLSEDIVNTIQVGNKEEEGEETSATISEEDIDENHDHEIEHTQLLGIISDDSDNELSCMYVQPIHSRKSTKGSNGDQNNLLDEEDIVP